MAHVFNYTGSTELSLNGGGGLLDTVDQTVALTDIFWVDTPQTETVTFTSGGGTDDRTYFIDQRAFAATAAGVTSLFFEGNLAETSASFDAYAGELTFTMFDPLAPTDLDGFVRFSGLDTLLLDVMLSDEVFPDLSTAFSAVNQSVIDAWTPLRTSFDAILAGTAAAAGTVTSETWAEGGTTPVTQFTYTPDADSALTLGALFTRFEQEATGPFGIDGADTRTALANEAVEIILPEIANDQMLDMAFAELTLRGGSLADVVRVAYNDASAANRSVTVVAGAGDDTVTVDVAEGDTILVEAGDDADTLQSIAVSGLTSASVTLRGGAGEDTFVSGASDDIMEGGADTDAAIFAVTRAEVEFFTDGAYLVVVNEGSTDRLRDIEQLIFADQTVDASTLSPDPLPEPEPDPDPTPDPDPDPTPDPDPETGVNLVGTPGVDALEGTEFADTIDGIGGDDVIDGFGGADNLDGGEGNDVVRGGDGNDTLRGGDGTDRLNGGAGDDTIFGGDTAADLRDVIFAGDGDDIVEGGYGQDLLYGQGGNDILQGGFGSDEIQGQDGNDTMTGSALSDLVFGGAGDDFVNGGFGFDRINGGSGADRFFHLGTFDHASDWIQDYTAAEGDTLFVGIAGAQRSDFNVVFTETENAGTAGVAEAFVRYLPGDQILFALVDGSAQGSINLQIAGDATVYDLLA